MLPMTLLAAQKLSSRLTTGNALQQQINMLAGVANVQIPLIPDSQVVLTSAAPDLADKSIQLSYPRACIYASGARNVQTEKFRSFSGFVSVTAEVLCSANLLTQADQWSHFYIEGLTAILRANIGDWGDGMFFQGAYDVQIQAPKAGGLGYVQSAKVNFDLQVSLS